MQYTVWSIQCEVYSVNLAVYIVQYLVCSVGYTVCSVKYAVCSVKYEVCNVQVSSRGLEASQAYWLEGRGGKDPDTLSNEQQILIIFIIQSLN